jgi:hypothetical protein
MRAFYTQMKKSNGQASRRRHAINYAAAAMEQMELYRADHPGSPSAVRRPQLFFRGDLWIALLGPSIEEGIVGIGATVSAALRAFDAQYLAGLRAPVETKPEVSALPPLPKAFAVGRRTYRNTKSHPKDRADFSGFAWPA